ncbi:MAG: TMEM165/GDT1 family protein [Caulobacteraceae bacterium]
MTPLLVSIPLVAVAEMGDKTQLLAIVLAARFKKPWLVIAGILVATLANHTLAAAAGYFLSKWMHGPWLQLAVGIGFVVMAGWTLIPDKEDSRARDAGRLGVFITTAITFFLVEMGDKTQIATAALAARFHDVFLVAAGTTIGMMLANIPAVLLGDQATKIVPLKSVRIAAAVIFVGLGVWTIFEALAGMR